MGVADHKAAAAKLAALAGAVLTVSDTRTEADDRSGALLKEMLEAAGHRTDAYRIVRDDPEQLREAVLALAEQADFVVLTGGTGMSPRDVTVEVCRPLFDKELEGFGDLFRYLSYQEIGSAAVMSRATAGAIGGSMVFCLPGSAAAVRLAMEKLVLPEVRHLISHIRK